MNSIQDWSNSNEGFIELSGHLTGAVQRSRQIQTQQVQLEALKGLQSELERQRLKQELVEASQNVLYDYKAVCGEISETIRQHSAAAFARLVLLENAVHQSGIGHELFSDLQWKDFCTKTLGEISELKSWALQNLDAATQQAGMGIVARFQDQAKHLEDERLAALKRAALLKQNEQRIKEGTRLGHISFWLGIAACLLCLFSAIPAVIFGHKALRAMQGIENAPRSYAMAGLIIGYVVLALLGVGILYGLSVGFSSR